MGGRKAAHVGRIHTEGSVDTCQEGLGRGEGKGGELEGQGVVRQAVNAGTLDGNGQDAPVTAG